MKTFLHVGCGRENKSKLKGFNSGDWREIRFDIDQNVKPDVLGTLTDMSAVESESVDAIYSSHNIEHLFPHEVPTALNEFRRVLKPNGIAVITCPDLISVCKAVVADKLLEPLYESPAGPISPIDIIFGHRPSIARGNHYMAHKCGFTYSVLQGCFFSAGFKKCFGGARPHAFDLWLIAVMDDRSDEALRETAQQFLP